MSSMRPFQLWPAQPHTVAKIEILERYLFRWFTIFGRSARGRDLYYIDGFAGPGRYTNHSAGSPVAALRAAAEARSMSGSNWIAGNIQCVFIEEDLATFQHLKQHIESTPQPVGVSVDLRRGSFASQIEILQRTSPAMFNGVSPLLAFIDPFGPTDVPFSIVSDILDSTRSEVLINFDADGIDRINRAGNNASATTLLAKIFGGMSWQQIANDTSGSRERYINVVNLYKSRLRELPNVRYAFGFEMRTARRREGISGYFLVFASQHHRGLEKMKEAMKTMDQTGDFSFSNARVGQHRLFRFDNPKDFSGSLHDHFAGRRATYDETRDFALNETPFTNPKGMLKDLEERNLISVFSNDPRRRRGTFAEEKIQNIEFLPGGDNG